MSATQSEQIARRVLDAFRRADAKYLAMSGGWRLHAAPEYFATVAIAKRIAKVDYVTLEQNIDDAIGWSGGRRLEASADNLSMKGRFDLAVWGEGNEGIKGVIEVKLGTWFTYAKVGGDVRRVCAALRRAPRLRWGMCAFHFACWTEVSKPGAERVDDRMQNILQSSQRHAAKNEMTCRAFFGERTGVEDWNGWSAGCAGSAALLFEREPI